MRLKAEMFQRTGSYKLRGPLNKLLDLTGEERSRRPPEGRQPRAGLDRVAVGRGGLEADAGIDARNYDGSFWEWAKDDALPVER